MEHSESQSSAPATEGKERQVDAATGAASLASSEENIRTLSGEELKLVGGGAKARTGTTNP